MRSIQTKLFAVIVLVTCTFIAFFSTYFPAREGAAARRVLEDKSATYARLIAQQVQSRTTFDDPETARDAFAAAARDADVHALALYRRGGEDVYHVGDIAGSGAIVRSKVDVVSRTGAPGYVVVELSTAEIDGNVALDRGLGLGMGAATLAAGLFAVWLVARSMARRLRDLTTATLDVSVGNLSAPLKDDPSADEIGELSRAFNAMWQTVSILLERFDLIVAERTAEIRLILDQMDQGLVIVDAEGIISDGHSKRLAKWFGTPTHTPLWTLTTAADAEFSLLLEMAWGMVADKDLPLDFAIDALPKRLRHGAQHLAVEYRPILDGDRLSKMLVVFTDVTSRVERERSDAAQRELLAAFERLSTDRVGFMAFFDETDRFVENLATSTLTPAFQRALHTLKGNSTLYGLDTLATHCHAIETEIQETGSLPPLDELEKYWRETKTRLAPVLGGARSARIELDENDYRNLVDGIASKPREELLRIVAEWRLEPAARRLERMAEQARAVASRLGKSELQVITHAPGIRLDAERWGPFWSAFVHVVRNAVDHGIESTEERSVLGKPAQGLLSIQAYRDHGNLVIEAADDGRGIDWEAIANRGREAGAPVTTRNDLEELLFRDGITTRHDASEYSGRGIGMSAVREAVNALGGVVRVRSSPSQGTAWRFVFPSQQA